VCQCAKGADEDFHVVGVQCAVDRVVELIFDSSNSGRPLCALRADGESDLAPIVLAGVSLNEAGSDKSVDDPAWVRAAVAYEHVAEFLEGEGAVVCDDAQRFRLRWSEVNPGQERHELTIALSLCRKDQVADLLSSSQRIIPRASTVPTQGDGQQPGRELQGSADRGIA